MYQVVKSPKEGGAVYTIAPVEDLGRVRCFHRSALKARIRKDAPVPASTDPPVLEKEVPSAEVSSEVVDLLMLVPAIPPSRLGASLSGAGFSGCFYLTE